MLFGTIFGVIVIPGLYYVFAKLQDGRSLIKNEDLNPLTENYVDSKEDIVLIKLIKNIIKRLRRQKNEQ
jgi:HAE1 family hydrophobic/amphiphilic exporter-1